jgi:hypothetical protein
MVYLIIMQFGCIHYIISDDDDYTSLASNIFSRMILLHEVN